MGNTKDALGDRMKEFYEKPTNYKLPRRAYTMIRLDGKAFHTYTKGLTRPFDWDLINDIDDTAKYLCKNIQGAKCAFVQSDEITIVITDFDNINTSAWFDNKIQKMCSVSASMATAKFNELRFMRQYEKSIENDPADYGMGPLKIAMFDARVFQIPSKGEVMNNFIWRQQDTVKNSISSAAHSMFSTEELKFKNGGQKQDMMMEKGVNWNDYDPKLKRGRMIVKETYEKTEGIVRTRWTSVAPPTFTQDTDYLNNLIPDM